MYERTNVAQLFAGLAGLRHLRLNLYRNGGGTLQLFRLIDAISDTLADLDETERSVIPSGEYISLGVAA